MEGSAIKRKPKGTIKKCPSLRWAFLSLAEGDHFFTGVLHQFNEHGAVLILVVGIVYDNAFATEF